MKTKNKQRKSWNFSSSFSLSLIENLKQNKVLIFLTTKKIPSDSKIFLYSRYTQKLDFVCKENSRLSDSFLLQSIHEKN